MTAISKAFHDVLLADVTLAGLLASYGGSPAVFTSDPVPGDAVKPYVITAGEVVHRPFDTKLTRGREIWRDVRCYADDTGSADTVEQIAERVRALLHRQIIAVDGFTVEVAECFGPVVADEPDAYGRIITARIIMMEG